MAQKKLSGKKYFPSDFLRLRGIFSLVLGGIEWKPKQ